MEKIKKSEKQASDQQDFHYRILGKIGEGSFGTVFKAVDQRSDTIVALKRIKIKKAEDGLPKEFLRELESLKLISQNYQ